MRLNCRRGRRRRPSVRLFSERSMNIGTPPSVTAAGNAKRMPAKGNPLSQAQACNESNSFSLGTIYVGAIAFTRET